MLFLTTHLTCLLTLLSEMGALHDNLGEGAQEQDMLERKVTKLMALHELNEQATM